jgi:hypothetical protein
MKVCSRCKKEILETSGWCKLCKSEYNKEYYQNNKSYYQEHNKRYFQENRQYFRDYEMNRLRNDTNYKLAKKLRDRVRHVVRGDQKAGSAVKDLGCSLNEYKLYLESKFRSGMAWENYGQWHIDHVRPLVDFDLTDREQFLEACHYTNLQPLWAGENWSKGAKI